jgi:hypothetical protein
MEAAACSGLEPEVADAYFFPERGQTGARAGSCVVGAWYGAQCLAQALSEPEEFGICGVAPAGVSGGAPSSRQVLCPGIPGLTAHRLSLPWPSPVPSTTLRGLVQREVVEGLFIEYKGD